MCNNEMDEARSRMMNGFQEFAGGLVDLVNLVFRDLVEAMKDIDWNTLARLKEADPDLFNWNASGPIRRVQLRRARALMEGKRHGL